MNNLIGAGHTGGRDDGSTFDGSKPFEGDFDFAKPNEKYFARCDRIIKLAAKHGLLVMLDPAETGSFLAVMQHNGEQKCRDYGRWLGKRYVGFDNLLWFHGNDYHDNTPENDKLTTAVALGIKEFDKRHLHTIEFDVRGGPITSLSDERWTSIVGLSGSYTYGPVYIPLLDDYNRKPAPHVPRFMMESSYEFEMLGGAQLGTPRQLRWQEYTSNLCGSTGQMYGNKYTWPFLDGWKDKLDTPGAVQMKWVKKLFEPRKWYELVPDQEHKVVTKGFGTFGKFDYAAAASSRDHTLAIVYIPNSRSVTVDLSLFARPVVARWYDPSSGKYQKAADAPLEDREEHSFTTPGLNSDHDADWVLVVETDLPDINELNTIAEFNQAKLKVAMDWRGDLAGHTWGGGIITSRMELVFAQALARAYFDVAADKTKRVEARQVIRDIMEDFDKKITALSIAQAVGGEPDRLAEAHYRLAEARVWLEEARESTPEVIAPLRMTKLKAAQEWLKAAGIAPARPFEPDPDQQVFAAQAMKDSTLEVAPGKTDRTDATRYYCHLVEEMYNRARRAADAKAGGDTEAVERAHYYLLEGKIWLKDLRPTLPESIDSLRKAKREAAQRWWNATSARTARETEPDYLQKILASRALRDAELDLSANRAERIAALTGHRDRMQKLFEAIDALNKADALGGEGYQLDEAKYELLEAKCLLLREEARK